MNAKRYFAHAVLAYHPSKHAIDVRAELNAHFQKTLSAEAVTATLRQRLSRRRQRDSLMDELARLERELTLLGELRDERIEKLRKKVEELKKKVGPTGP